VSALAEVTETVNRAMVVTIGAKMKRIFRFILFLSAKE